MKSAYFKYTNKDKVNSHTVYGKVTLKDDGKISITQIYGDRSYSDKFKAKEYAKDIVAKDFPSDMCYDFKTTENSSVLESKLLENTVEFKIDFLERTKKYCENYFIFLTNKINKTLQERYLEYDIEFNPINDQLLRSDENYSKYIKYKNDYIKYKNLFDLGIEKYTSIELSKSELHYINSINKLAFKLYEKGIIGTDFTIHSGKVNHNFECIIHHNKIDGKYTKITKAWTIIAEGPIQSPHYRYLIK